ncbi:MAG: hypothetical protein V1727_03390 [Candidatus Omnitrophota bacterium]
MSIINDALKKAEKQQAGYGDTKMRVLNDINVMSRTARSHSTRRWFLWSGTVIVYGLSLYLFLSPGPGSIPLEPTRAPAQQQALHRVPLAQNVLNLRKIDFEFPTVDSANFQLSGIVYDQKRPLAIINSRIVGEGNLVDGARLLEIQPNFVKLSYKDAEFNLKIK